MSKRKTRVVTEEVTVELPVLETPVVETEVQQPEVVELVVEEPTVEEPVVETPVVETEEPTTEVDEVHVRRHMTPVVRGDARNGIRVPSLNGLCHAAWKVFDSMTEVYVDENGEDRVALPNVADTVMLGVSMGLNPNNVRYEYPRWRKFNGFPAVARTAKK